MNKSIQITGSTGFIGANLIKTLHNNYTLQPLSVRYNPNQTIVVNANIVIHLAGKAHDLKKANFEEYNEANNLLTQQLYDSFLQSKTSKVFIFMSTVKAVADKLDSVLTEDTLPSPQTPYGIAKHRAEEYILSKTLSNDKKVYILRPCMVHGVGNKGNLNLLYKVVSKGIPWPLGNFENKRSFLSVDNLCFVIQQLLVRGDIPSGVYNVADSESISTNKLIRIIGESIGKKSIVLKIPKVIIKKIAQCGDFLHLPLNTERLEKLTETYEVSNQKILQVLGKPMPINAEEGLFLTLKSFKEN